VVAAAILRPAPRVSLLRGRSYNASLYRIGKARIERAFNRETSMSSETTCDTIRRLFMESLFPVHVEIADDSSLHAGHSGARAGGGHFRVTIVSEAFDGLGPVARHRLVYQVLADEMKESIHALALKTLTPDEWRGEDQPD